MHMRGAGSSGGHAVAGGTPQRFASAGCRPRRTCSPAVWLPPLASAGPRRPSRCPARAACEAWAAAHAGRGRQSPAPPAPLGGAALQNSACRLATPRPPRRAGAVCTAPAGRQGWGGVAAGAAAGLSRGVWRPGAPPQPPSGWWGTAGAGLRSRAEKSAGLRRGQTARRRQRAAAAWKCRRPPAGGRSRGPVTGQAIGKASGCTAGSARHSS